MVVHGKGHFKRGATVRIVDVVQQEDPFGVVSLVAMRDSE